MLQKKSLADELLDPVAHEMADLLSNQVSIEKEELEKLIHTSLKDETYKMCNRLLKARKLLEKAYAQSSDEVKASLGNIAKKLYEAQEDKAALQEICIWCYDIGYNFFQKKELENALAVFQALTFLNPQVASYFLALGQTQKALGLFNEALYSLSACSLLNPEEPLSRYLCCTLYLDQNLLEDAQAEFDALSQITKKHPEHLPLLTSLKQHLQFKKTKGGK